MEHAGAFESILPSDAQVGEIKRHLTQYNATRASVLRNGIIRVALVVAGLATLLALMIFLANNLDRKGGAVVLLLTGPVGVLGFWQGLKWAWLPVRDRAQSLRYEMMPIAFGFVDRLRYRYAVSPGFLEGARRLGLVLFTRSETDDSIDGQHDGVRFALALSRLMTGSGKSQRTVFRGLVLHVVLEADFAGRVVVARKNSNWLAEVINTLFPGPDSVLTTGMEDLDGAYAIHTDNRQAAQEKLATRLVPILQFLRRIWRSADIRIALSGRECYLMLASDREFFALPGARGDIDYERHVKPMIRDLAEMLAVARLLSKL